MAEIVNKDLEELELVQKIIQRYTYSKDATQELRQTKWQQYLNTYIQKHETNSKREYRSQIYVPLAFQQIRTLVPFLMSTIFNSDPLFKMVDATGLRPDEKMAIEKLIDRQCYEMDFYSRLNEFLLGMCIYGTAIAKVYWENDVQPVTKTRKTVKTKYTDVLGMKVPSGFQTVEESYTEDKINYDGPVFENIDLWHFFIDPKADRLEGYWKGHLIERSLEEMKGSKRYKNLDQLEALLNVTTSTNQEDKQVQDLKRAEGVRVDEQREDKKGCIKLLEYWVEDDSRCYVVALDYGVIVSEKKNPFKHGQSPFVSAAFQPVPHSFFGMGVPEIVYGLQRNVNTITNQRNDNLSLIINRMWKYKRDGSINPSQLKSVPGGLIPVDEMDSVEPLELKDVTQNAYLEVQANKSEAQEAIGTKYLSGANPTGSNRTATGVRLNQNAEASSIMGIFNLLEETCLRPMVDMIYSMNDQFLDRDVAVEIIGPRGQTIEFGVKPQLFNRYRSFYAAGIRNVNQKDVLVHQMENFLGIVARIPPQMIVAYKINIPEILKKIWENMGLDDANSIIGGDTQGAAQEMLAFQQQQAQAEGMGAPGTPPTPGNTMNPGNIMGGQNVGGGRK